MKRKRSRFRRWAIRTAIALAVVAAILHLPVPAKMTISPETTVVTGPLNADGTVNYVDALNEMMSEGITPANNAAVLLVGAFGRGAWPERTRAELFRRLGIDALPAEGEYLVSVEAWEKAHPGQPLSEQYDAATSRPWTPDELPHAAAWLAENQRPLDLMVAAAGRPRCYLPLLSNATPPRMIDAQLTSGGHLRLGVLALIARARLRAGQGKLQAAWSDILALHRLSRLMRDEPAVVLHLLRRGIERLAVEGGIELAADPRLTGAQAKRMLADLKSLPKGADLAEVVDCGERFSMLDVFMMIRRGVDIDAMEVSPEDPPPKPRRWFEADEALRVANDWYDRLVEALRQPTYASRSRALAAFVRDLQAMAKKTWSGGRIRVALLRLGGWPCRKAHARTLARVMLRIMMPVVEVVSRTQDQVRMHADLEKVAFALAAYRAENDRSPKALKELSPEYLEEIPLDRFTDKPLIYRAAKGGYVLYSLGPDMTDNGGRTEREDRGACDIVVRMPPPTTAPAGATGE